MFSTDYAVRGKKKFIKLNIMNAIKPKYFLDRKREYFTESLGLFSLEYKNSERSLGGTQYPGLQELLREGFQCHSNWE